MFREGRVAETSLSNVVQVPALDILDSYTFPIWNENTFQKGNQYNQWNGLGARVRRVQFDIKWQEYYFDTLSPYGSGRIRVILWSDEGAYSQIRTKKVICNADGISIDDSSQDIQSYHSPFGNGVKIYYDEFVDIWNEELIQSVPWSGFPYTASTVPADREFVQTSSTGNIPTRYLDTNGVRWGPSNRAPPLVYQLSSEPHGSIPSTTFGGAATDETTVNSQGGVHYIRRQFPFSRDSSSEFQGDVQMDQMMRFTFEHPYSINTGGGIYLTIFAGNESKAGAASFLFPFRAKVRFTFE
jgi:hypothetical protein